MATDNTSDDSLHTTRRSVLRAATGAAAGLGVTGVVASESGDRLEVNIGFANERGRRAALEAASDVHREFNFDALTVTVPRQALSGLQRNPNVRYVEENGEMHALAQSTPWGIDRVGATDAHDAGETGDGADIVIIDTGIDPSHEDLEANVGEGRAWVSCRGGRCEADWDDDNDHGTHCAGTADALDNDVGVVGVSTEATLHAAKVLDRRGSGRFSDIAAAIEWTADQGYDVGSMSLGGGQSSAVSDACTYAHERGVFLVAAAGNDGPCGDCVSYPAAEPEVVAVSATSDDDSLANFSSTGPEIELAAPGEGVNSTVPGGYDTFSGTSMACPHVAGAAGQLMANGYTHEEARNRLHETAEDIGLGENEQGHGLLRVDEALGL